MKVYIFDKLDSDFRIDHYSGIGFPQDRKMLHSHPYHEFSLIIAGDISYTSNKCVEHVNGKCFIFSAANQLHNPFVNQEKKYERYQIMFRSDFLASFLPEYHSIFSPVMAQSAIWRVSDVTFKRMSSIMETLHDRYENDPDTMVAGLEYKLLVAELMILASDTVTEHTKREKLQTGSYIDEVIKYIQKHYAQEIKLDVLARMFSISYTKLANDFKKHVGMTICNFITLTRVEAAKSLLQQGNSVNSVAALVGYPGTSYFIKIFKRCTQMTPLKFQRTPSTNA